MSLNGRIGAGATGLGSGMDGQTRFFTFADLMLRELGWVPLTAATT